MSRSVTAELLKVHRNLDLDADLVPVVAGPVRRYRLRHGTVEELDGRLRLRRVLPMGVPLDMALLAVDPAGDRVAVTDDGAVHVIPAEGERTTVEVPAVDTATFLPDGDLLLTAPRPDHSHEVILVDTAKGRVLALSLLDVDDAVVTATAHPHDGSVLLEAALGDAGSVLYLARADAGALTVERIAENVYAGGFPPAGDRLLLLPHPKADDGVSVLSWPGRRPVASFTPDDDRVELGCFLDDDRIMLKTHRPGLLVCTAALEPATRVDLDLASVVGDDGAEVSIVLGLSADTVAVDVWDGGELVPTVWWLDDRDRHPAVTGTDDLSVRLARVAAKLEQARERNDPAMFGADSHRFRLAPPLPEHAVDAFERAHGVTLPLPYRAFITRLGHGGPGGSAGAGPFYGLEPLDGWALGLRGNPAPDTLRTPFAAVPGVGDPAYWDRAGEPFTGTVTVSHQGCAHYSLLVVSGPARGRVTAATVGLSPREATSSDAPTGPTFTDDPDFLAWYERWLDAVLAGAKGF